jgi:hypothetical protein
MLIDLFGLFFSTSSHYLQGVREEEKKREFYLLAHKYKGTNTHVQHNIVSYVLEAISLQVIAITPKPSLIMKNIFQRELNFWCMSLF